MNFLGLGRKQPKNDGLEVDFDQPIALPRDAQNVLWHHSAGKGKLNLLAQHLEMRPIPRGMTYLEYCKENPEAIFGDVLILNSFISAVVKNGDIDEVAVKRILGNFTGQIFFLATAFEAIYEGRKRTCFAYLNWRTHYPALRYICPADHPINHDVNCCALHIVLPTGIAA